MQTHKIGIIGVCGRGRHACKALRPEKDFEIVMGADPFEPSARNYTFIGTKGRVENIGDHGNCQVHLWTRRGLRATPDIVYNMKPVSGGHGGADDPIIDNFLDFVANGARTNVNPVAARDAVAVSVPGYYSMRNGNTQQEIPQLEPELLEYFANNQQW